ncbi:MAG: peroxiredoxin [Nitrospinota bacterium]|nr:peroxiredoxin [Nitrospinota bacterium]|tara:strand:+ start:1814 stop:2251 length:438 start_codon:yes stop_codon:yes gene_type:complete
MLQPGADAPEFSVNDHNGNKINLKDFLGKKIVLWFYPKADTPGCTMEGQGFRDDFKKFQQKDIQIFGVSLDNENDNKAFAEKFSFPYPLLCDVDREVALSYQAVSSKEDQYAARISYVIGEDGKILESIENVDTKNHSNDLCSRY